MSLYRLIRPLLFLLDAETAHNLTLAVLAWLPSCLFSKQINDPCECFGLQFPNRIGLAAGLDKNGDYIDALAKLGFGFIEVGTVTPLPQPGNPRPRMFRATADKALINRMGFNNKGVDHMVARLQKRNFQGILGVNIGKNLATPLENALDDYQACFEKVYPYASYVTVNVSSPNTPGLRKLQSDEYLRALLQPLKEQQAQLHQAYNRYVPLLVKIAPDETEESLSSIAKALLDCQVDGVIATNTTVDHQDISNKTLQQEAGGVSGAVLTAKSTDTVSKLANLLQQRIPIIGVGGIMTAADAQAKRQAGATLLQLYSGLIYRGPNLVKEAAQAALESS